MYSYYDVVTYTFWPIKFVALWFFFSIPFISLFLVLGCWTMPKSSLYVTSSLLFISSSSSIVSISCILETYPRLLCLFTLVIVVFSKNLLVSGQYVRSAFALMDLFCLPLNCLYDVKHERAVWLWLTHVTQVLIALLNNSADGPCSTVPDPNRSFCLNA